MKRGRQYAPSASVPRSEYEGEAAEARIDPIYRALEEEHYVHILVSEHEVSTEQEMDALGKQRLLRLIYELQVFMEGQLGLDSLRQWPMTKLPAHIFRDYRPSGALTTVVRECLKYKMEMGWPEFYFLEREKEDDNIGMIMMAEDALVAAGQLKRPHVYLAPHLGKESHDELIKLVTEHNGRVVGTRTEADYAVIRSKDLVDDLDGEEEWEKKAVLVETRPDDGLGLVHWKHTPDSYDQWVDLAEAKVLRKRRQVAHEAAPHEGWEVSTKFLHDLKKYNEWMNPLDYDLSFGADQETASTPTAAAEAHKSKRRKKDKKPSVKVSFDGSTEDASSGSNKKAKKNKRARPSKSDGGEEHNSAEVPEGSDFMNVEGEEDQEQPLQPVVLKFRAKVEDVVGSKKKSDRGSKKRKNKIRKRVTSLRFVAVAPDTEVDDLRRPSNEEGTDWRFLNLQRGSRVHAVFQRPLSEDEDEAEDGVKASLDPAAKPEGLSGVLTGGVPAENKKKETMRAVSAGPDASAGQGSARSQYGESLVSSTAKTKTGDAQGLVKGEKETEKEKEKIGAKGEGQQEDEGGEQEEKEEEEEDEEEAGGSAGSSPEQAKSGTRAGDIGAGSGSLEPHSVTEKSENASQGSSTKDKASNGTAPSTVRESAVKSEEISGAGAGSGTAGSAEAKDEDELLLIMDKSQIVSEGELRFFPELFSPKPRSEASNKKVESKEQDTPQPEKALDESEKDKEKKEGAAYAETAEPDVDPAVLKAQRQKMMKKYLAWRNKAVDECEEHASLLTVIQSCRREFGVDLKTALRLTDYLQLKHVLPSAERLREEDRRRKRRRGVGTVGHSGPGAIVGGGGPAVGLKKQKGRDGSVKATPEAIISFPPTSALSPSSTVGVHPSESSAPWTGSLNPSTASAPICDSCRAPCESLFFRSRALVPSANEGGVGRGPGGASWKREEVWKGRELPTTVCPRCFYDGKYPPNLFSEDFVQHQLEREKWSEEETLSLLEAVYDMATSESSGSRHKGRDARQECLAGDNLGIDWEVVAEKVEGRTEKECLRRFLTLPIGEQLRELLRQEDVEADMPFEDLPNPLLALLSFLVTRVHPEVGAGAAQSAMHVLIKKGSSEPRHVLDRLVQDRRMLVSLCSAAIDGATAKAKRLLHREKRNIQKLYSQLVQKEAQKVQLKLYRHMIMEQTLDRELKVCQGKEKSEEEKRKERLRKEQQEKEEKARLQREEEERKLREEKEREEQERRRQEEMELRLKEVADRVRIKKEKEREEQLQLEAEERERKAREEKERQRLEEERKLRLMQLKEDAKEEADDAMDVEGEELDVKEEEEVEEQDEEGEQAEEQEDEGEKEEDEKEEEEEEEEEEDDDEEDEEEDGNEEQEQEQDEEEDVELKTDGNEEAQLEEVEKEEEKEEEDDEDGEVENDSIEGVPEDEEEDVAEAENEGAEDEREREKALEQNDGEMAESKENEETIDPTAVDTVGGEERKTKPENEEGEAVSEADATAAVNDAAEESGSEDEKEGEHEVTQSKEVIEAEVNHSQKQGSSTHQPQHTSNISDSELAQERDEETNNEKEGGAEELQKSESPECAQPAEMGVVKGLGAGEKVDRAPTAVKSETGPAGALSPERQDQQTNEAEPSPAASSSEEGGGQTGQKKGEDEVNQGGAAEDVSSAGLLGLENYGPSDEDEEMEEDGKKSEKDEEEKEEEKGKWEAEMEEEKREEE